MADYLSVEIWFQDGSRTSRRRGLYRFMTPFQHRSETDWARTVSADILAMRAWILGEHRGAKIVSINYEPFALSPPVNESLEAWFDEIGDTFIDHFAWYDDGLVTTVEGRRHG